MCVYIYTHTHIYIYISYDMFIYIYIYIYDRCLAALSEDRELGNLTKTLLASFAHGFGNGCLPQW